MTHAHKNLYFPLQKSPLSQVSIVQLVRLNRREAAKHAQVVKQRKIRKIVDKAIQTIWFDKKIRKVGTEICMKFICMKKEKERQWQ